MFRIIQANILEQRNLRSLTVYELVCFKYGLEKKSSVFMRETDFAKECTSMRVLGNGDFE